jgi:hypothetical protein
VIITKIDSFNHSNAYHIRAKMQTLTTQTTQTTQPTQPTQTKQPKQPTQTVEEEYDFENDDDSFYDFIEFGIASNGGRLSIRGA